MKNIEGVVEQISKNETGIRVNGTWYNFSKYAPLSLKPKIGDRVKLTLDDNWIKGMDILPKANAKENSVEEKPNTVPAKEENSTVSFKKSFDPKPYPIQDKDIRISRLAVLNTATEILKTHSHPITVEDVIEIAQELLQWALATADQTDVSDPNSSDLNDIPF